MRTLLLFTIAALTVCAQPRFFAEIQVQQGVRPIAGASANLGNTSNRFANTFTNFLTLTGTPGSGGVASHVIPSTDATWDLGTLTGGTNRWRNLHASGTLFGGALDIQAGTAIVGAILPVFSGIYSNGTNSNRWANVFSNVLTISSGLGQGVSSHMYPATDNTWNLGTSGQRWASADIAGTVTTGNIVSQSAGSFSLGNTGNRWANIFSNALVLSSGVGQGLSSDFFPATDNTWALGGSGRRFSTANIAGTVTTGNVVSQAASTHSLGISSNRWSNIFTDAIVVSSGAGQGVSSNFQPATNFTWLLGGSSNRWDVFFGRFANLQSNAGSLAGFSIRDTGSTERAYLGDGGGTGGELRLINSAGSEFFGAINGVVRANGTNALTTTVTVPCGTLTFTQGLLTSKGTCP